MSRPILLVTLALVLCASVYGDSMPVAGSTTGSFLSGSATLGTASGDTWSYNNGANASSVVYGSLGTSFGLANTPLDINLGSLTLTNGGNGGSGSGTIASAVLDLTVTFSTPPGSVVLPDTITLTLTNGSNGQDILLSSLPTESFTIGTETYTVSIDGLYDAASGGNLLTNGLFVLNPGGGNGSEVGEAYLRGTVTSSGSTTAVVPEPGSVSLLLTALAGVVFSLRRKRAR